MGEPFVAAFSAAFGRHAAITGEVNLAAAAAIVHFLPVAVRPTAVKDRQFLQPAGWGYPGVLVGVPTPAAEALNFVYRPRRRLRIKARKRSFN